MAEDIGDKIVERLKQEGQLTRNTGTNSIKTLRTEFAKFTDVFQSINANVMEQTQILRETLQLQMEEANRAERARQLEEARRSGPPTGGPSSAGGDRERQGPTPQGGGLMAGLASLFGGGLGGFGGALGGTALAALRTPLRTAILAVLAPAVGKLLGGFTEAALSELGADVNVATQFGEAANFAGLAGMVGLAFGRRMGLVGAGAGAAASFGDDVLDAIGLDKDSMISILGMEMQTETIAQGVLGALGAAVTTAATSPSFRASITNFFKDSVDADGNPLSRFPRRRAMIGGMIGTAVLGAYLTYGEDVKDWLETQGMPEGFADTTVDVVGLTAAGASLGAMFGPQGALVGAAIGFAIGLGKNVVDWMQGMREEATAEFNEQVASAQEVMARAAAGEQVSEEERRQIATVAAEARRRTQLALPGEQGAAAQSVLEEAERALAAQPLNAEQGITQSQVQQRVMAALSGNQESFNELVQYVKDREEATADDFFRFSSRETFLRRLLEGLVYDAPMDYLAQNPDVFDRWQNMVEQVMQTEGYRTGTKGFMDFGKGSFAVLHGREAVVPESTPAGQFLKNYFDENWQPLMNRVNEVSNAAMSQLTGSVTYAPVTLAPVTNNNVRGGSSSTVINSLSKDRSDLDYFARPAGVQ